MCMRVQRQSISLSCKEIRKRSAISAQTITIIPQNLILSYRINIMNCGVLNELFNRISQHKLSYFWSIDFFL